MVLGALAAWKHPRPAQPPALRQMRAFFLASIAALLLTPGALPMRAADADRDARLAFLEKRTSEDPDDFIAWAQLSDRCLQRHRESGDDDWLKKARKAAEASLKAIPANSNTAGLAASARVALAEHRFNDVRAKAEQLVKLDPDKVGPLVLLSDALIECGKIEDAAKAIARLEEIHAPSLVTRARRARLSRLCGELDAARAHYEAARTAARDTREDFWVCWAEVQLGELAFARGDWDEAEAHYTTAVAMQPKWWATQEHLAELRAAQGRDEEALKIYHELIARLPRPELLQAVGDLHLFRGRTTEAKAWHDRSLSTYQRMTADGSVAMFHHLAGFYCDSQRNPAEAVKWARKDLELRDTAAARDALAWALYLSGDIAGAQAEIAKALGTNPRNPHVLQHAGMIRMSAGEIESGQAALREVLRLNPRFQSFHVHR